MLYLLKLNIGYLNEDDQKLNITTIQYHRLSNHLMLALNCKTVLTGASKWSSEITVATMGYTFFEYYSIAYSKTQG